MEKEGQLTELQDILQIITNKDINDRLKRTKDDTAAGPHSLTKKEYKIY
jgi:hypothetical protein